MKTVIIHVRIDEPIQFFVVDKDLTHLDNIFINSFEDDEAKQDELLEIIADLEPLKKFPKQAVIDGAEVIVTGFLP